MQRDPIGHVDGMNLYEFARSRPVGLVDPWGLGIEPDKIAGPDDVMLLINGKDRVRGYMDRGDDWADHLLRWLGFLGLLPGQGNWLERAIVRQFVHNGSALVSLSMGFNPGGRGQSESNRFVYTCKHGWIDMGHFYITATAAYLSGGEMGYQMGIWMEKIQQWWKDRGFNDDWARSAYTKEDLRSDWLGAQLGDRVRGSTVLISSGLAAGLKKAVGVGLNGYELAKDMAKLFNESEAVDPDAGGGAAGAVLRLDAMTSAQHGHVRETGDWKKGTPPPPGRSIFHWCFCNGDMARRWCKAAPVTGNDRRKIWTKPALKGGIRGLPNMLKRF